MLKLDLSASPPIQNYGAIKASKSDLIAVVASHFGKKSLRTAAFNAGVRISQNATIYHPQF